MTDDRKIHIYLDKRHAFGVLLGMVVVVGFSFAPTLFATAPSPGHNFTEASGGVVQGDILYGSAADTLLALPKNTTAARYLSNSGTSNNPAWAQVDLATGVTGLLPLANGGTAANLSASNGGILYSGSSAFAVLAGTATANKVLMSGATAAPSWSTATYPTTAGTSGNILQSDGTNFTSSTGGVLLGKQIFTSGTGATYTPTSGTTKIIVEMWGGGGAGGSCTAVAGCACGGGGSGGYALYYDAPAGSSYTYTVGTAGAASAGAAGGSGGNSTFVDGATTVTAFGGTGGGFTAGSAATKYTTGGAGGVISTNGTINAGGAPGGWGSTSATATIGATGDGGSTALGGGGAGRVYSSAAAVAGNAAIANTGSGGSGGGTGAATVAAGGAGAAGLIVIWEYR